MVPRKWWVESSRVKSGAFLNPTGRVSRRYSNLSGRVGLPRPGPTRKSRHRDKPREKRTTARVSRCRIHTAPYIAVPIHRRRQRPDLLPVADAEVGNFVSTALLAEVPPKGVTAAVRVPQKGGLSKPVSRYNAVEIARRDRGNCTHMIAWNEKGSFPL